MGMYTELDIGVRLKPDTPQWAIDTLDAMARENGEPVPPGGHPHPLFETSRWTWMLKAKGSYYFDRQSTLVWRYDKIARAWFLSVCTNIKNYEEEWEKFLDWLAPFVEEGDAYLGTYRYEGCEWPTLVYLIKGRIVMHEITPPKDVTDNYPGYAAKSSP